MPDASTVFLVSLGCPKNRVDSEVILGDLVERGYRVVESAEQADVLVVNTCSFVEAAREESVDTILELASAKSAAGDRPRLVVAGCLAQRYKDELEAEIPEIDVLIGTGELTAVGELVERSRSGRRETAVGAPGYNYAADTRRLVTTPPWTAWVKVAEGCSRGCSFCVIPRLRGKQRSRAAADVRREVARLARHGVKEVNLIAQDLSRYGADLDDGSNLAGLLRELLRIDGPRWFRLLYCNPQDVTDELIELIAAEDRIASYVDMPLQHLTDRMLTAMRRRTGEEATRAIVRRVRQRIPGVVLRTTFLVGHPGERDEDFEALLRFVEETRFDRLGVFRYSLEEGTAAARMDGQVPEELKEERYHRLMELQQAISTELQAEMIGRRLEVLVEGPSEETPLLLQGRTEGQAPEVDGLVYINEGWAEAGTIAPAEIVDAGPYDLVARLV